MEEINTTDLPLNYTDTGYEDTEKYKKYLCIEENNKELIIAGVFIIVCLCGLVGNMVVIWFLGCHMKKNRFTVYVLNLAIADFSLLFFILAILTLYIILIIDCFDVYKYIVLWQILTVVFLFWYLASMYFLTAMSIERCLSVLFPIWYRCHRPKHLSGVVCAVLWALAALSLSFALISCIFPLHIDCDNILEGLSTVNFLIFCLFPLLSNLSLFIRLRCGSQRRKQGKLYVAILLSMIFMFLFGLPLTMTFLEDFDTPLLPLYVGYLLATVNSSINPVIYFLVGSCRKRRLQGSMKVALRRVFEDKVTSEERSHLPGETLVETTV